MVVLSVRSMLSIVKAVAKCGIYVHKIHPAFIIILVTAL